MAGISAPRLLIVEDEAELCDELRWLLERDGYAVTWASGGEEGLRLLTKEPLPSLILLDVMMPHGNGWEFVEAVEQMGPPWSSVPIVILSAFENTARTFRTARATLTKPVGTSKLLATLRAILDSRWRSATA